MPGARQESIQHQDIANQYSKVREAERRAISRLVRCAKERGTVPLQTNTDESVQQKRSPIRGDTPRLSDDEKKREAARRNRWAREAKQSTVTGSLREEIDSVPSGSGARVAPETSAIKYAETDRPLSPLDDFYDGLFEHMFGDK
jgi:hypothetical protein